MNALLVFNPGAGRARRLDPLRLLAALKKCGLQARLLVLDDPALATSAVKQALRESPAQFQRIIAAGGDGTIHALLPALVESPCAIPLAILPLGSVNVFMRELGLPRALPAAIEIAAHGKPRPVDLGLFNSDPFILMAGLGFDGAVVKEIKGNVKARLGSLTYGLQGLRMLFAQPAQNFHIVCDDTAAQVRAWQIVVANASHYTYSRSLAPHARIDDGRLEVCILPEGGRWLRLRQVLAILLGHPGEGLIKYLSGRRITIATESAVAVQMDGDPMPAITQAQIEILPRRLQVMTP